MPVLHLVAGPNGAGKSTLYRYLIEPRHPDLVFVNADIHEQAFLQHIANPVKRSEAARMWADKERETCLAQGRSFVTETVFSHPSKIDLMREAQAAGFEVALYIVCIDEPRQLLVRVRQRVKEGGHDVPANKVLERYPRTLENLAKAVRVADLAMLFHGRDVADGGPSLLASIAAGRVTMHAPELPTWARKVMAGLA